MAGDDVDHGQWSVVNLEVERTSPAGSFICINCHVGNACVDRELEPMVNLSQRHGVIFYSHNTEQHALSSLAS